MHHEMKSLQSNANVNVPDEYEPATSENANGVFLFTSKNRTFTKRGPRSRDTFAVNVFWRDRLSDLYHDVVTASTLTMFLGAVALYLLCNVIFAALIAAQGKGAVTNASSFGDYFVFAVQTWATIGYGSMYPESPYAHFLVTMFAILSLIVSYSLTGIIYARFAKPVARMHFSKNMLVTTFNTRPCIMFRLANPRSKNRILSANLEMCLQRYETSSEGIKYRQVHELSLLFQKVPVFSLHWLGVHYIDTPDSPLYDLDKGKVLSDVFRSIVVTLTGHDEDTASSLCVVHTYFPQSFLFNVTFEEMVFERDDGALIVDHARMNNVRPLKSAQA